MLGNRVRVSGKATGRVFRALGRTITGASTWLQWLILRITCPDCQISIDEISERRYKTKMDPDPTNIVMVDEAIAALAKSIYEEEHARTALVHDKAKTLITISSLALPILMALSAQAVYCAWVAAATCIVVSLVLLLMSFAVGPTARPSLDAVLLAHARPRAAIAGDYLRATNYNIGATNFLSDVYRGAHRALIVGLVLFVVAIASAQWPSSRPSQTASPWPRNLAQDQDPSVPVLVIESSDAHAGD